MNDTAHFRDIESDAIYACLGLMGGVAIFRLHPGAATWEFLVPESPAWDAVHQRIYRNHRVEALRADELPALPPLPSIPGGAFPDAKEYFLPGPPLEATRYPSVARLLQEQTGRSVTVFVVLVEDTYETAFGDGEFHYFREVFLTEAEAAHFVEGHAGEWTRFHVRPVTIALEDGTIGFPGWRPALFDHYEPEHVLAELEGRG